MEEIAPFKKAETLLDLYEFVKERDALSALYSSVVKRPKLKRLLIYQDVFKPINVLVYLGWLHGALDDEITEEIGITLTYFRDCFYDYYAKFNGTYSLKATFYIDGGEQVLARQIPLIESKLEFGCFQSLDRIPINKFLTSYEIPVPCAIVCQFIETAKKIKPKEPKRNAHPPEEYGSPMNMFMIND